MNTKSFGYDMEPIIKIKTHDIWEINPEYIVKEKDDDLIIKIRGRIYSEDLKMWSRILEENKLVTTDDLSIWLRATYDAGLEPIGDHEYDIIFRSKEDKVQFMLTWTL